MQRALLTILLAVVTVVLLMALLFAFVPEETATGGWRSVNGEMRELIGGEDDTGAGKAGEKGGGTDRNGGKNAETGQDGGKDAGAQMPKPSAEEEDSVPARININTATAEELDLLPGIGPAKARAIVEYRETYGRFETPEQLMEVKGIGQKTFERLKDLIEL